MRHLITLLLSLIMLLPLHTLADADYWLLTDLATSAEVAAGGGVEGFSHSANNVFENPAGLYRVQNGSVALFTTQIMGEVDYLNASIGAKTDFGTFAVGFMQASIADIPHTAQRDDLNETFYSLYNFDYRNTIIKATYQNSWSENTFYGVSLVRYKHDFDDVSGEGYNVDMGMLANWEPWEVSLSLRNVIDSLDIDYDDDGKENLPLQVTLGTSLSLEEFRFRAQSKTQSGQTALSAGLTYLPDALEFMSVSAGYRQFIVLSDIQDTFSFGFGLMLGGVSFHYAYEKSDHFEFDNKNYFSLNFDF